MYGGHPLTFGVGELIEEGTLVRYMLIDEPLAAWIVYEDVA
jgi:hypothetical protein